MHYSKEYSKLNDIEYTTIRRYNKGRKVGYIVPEYVDGTFSHYAEIKALFRRSFNDIPLKLLLKDTDCKNRSAAFDLLQAFYPKDIDKKGEKLYIYHLVKVQVVNEKRDEKLGEAATTHKSKEEGVVGEKSLVPCSQSLNKKKKCSHDYEMYSKYFKKQGIERKGIYCKNCNKLIYYFPQYVEDD